MSIVSIDTTQHVHSPFHVSAQHNNRHQSQHHTVPPPPPFHPSPHQDHHHHDHHHHDHHPTFHSGRMDHHQRPYHLHFQSQHHTFITSNVAERNNLRGGVLVRRCYSGIQQQHPPELGTGRRCAFTFTVRSCVFRAGGAVHWSPP